jgi:hypothetical protein
MLVSVVASSDEHTHSSKGREVSGTNARKSIEDAERISEKGKS